MINLNDWVMPNEQVIIRLEKYKEQATTKGGLTIEKMKVYDTEGGREVATKDRNYNYTPKGVIIKVGSKVANYYHDAPEVMDKLKVGAEVIVPRQVVDPRNQFFLDTEDKVVDFDGYIKIHPTQIDLIK